MRIRIYLVTVPALVLATASFAGGDSAPNPYSDAPARVNELLQESLESIGPDYKGIHQYFNDEVGNVALILLLLLCVCGMFLDRATPHVEQLPVEALKRLPANVTILLVYGLLFLLVATVAAVRYRDWLAALLSQGNMLFLASLFLAMAGGMFTSVIAKNYREKRAFSEVTAFQLLFPLVFSPMVFFAIYLTSGKINLGQDPTFGLCTAFIYGYFWERVVVALDPTKGKG